MEWSDLTEFEQWFVHNLLVCQRDRHYPKPGAPPEIEYNTAVSILRKMEGK